MRKLIIVFICISAIIFTFFSCTKDEAEVWQPLIKTSEIAQTDTSGIQFEAAILNLGSTEITEFGVLCDTSTITKYTQEKAIPFDAVVVGKSTKWEKATFDMKYMYHVRAYALTKKGVILGNETTFKGKRDCEPHILDYFPKTDLEPNDTITIVGQNFNRFKESITAKWASEWGTSKLSVKYVNKDTIKICGPIYPNNNLLITFNKSINLTLNNNFTIYNIQNPQINRIITYIGDTLTISWKNKVAIDKNCSIYKSYNYYYKEYLKIIDISETQIKFIASYPLFREGNWKDVFILNYRGKEFNFNLEHDRDLVENPNFGMVNSGSKIIIKFKKPILNSIATVVFGKTSDYNNITFNSKAIDQYNLEVEIPSETMLIQYLLRDRTSFYDSSTLKPRMGGIYQRF